MLERDLGIRALLGEGFWGELCVESAVLEQEYEVTNKARLHLV